jgi:cytochrome c553
MQKIVSLIALMFGTVFGTAVWAASPQDTLQQYEASSGPASAQRGQQFFTSKHGREWSCASCHSAVPNKTTQHIVTGKTILPLAPAANDKRFTDAAKSEKWFKRNCKDVLARECTSQEKVDIIAWLLTIK